MDNIMLVDTLNQCWRANMVWAHSRDTAEQNYIMIYNFFKNLRALIEQFSPSKVFMVLEGRPKHRYELYGGYKANRIVKTAEKKEKNDKFYLDVSEIVRIGKMLPLTFCKADNYECDDVIASLCEDLKEENIVVISNDSDYIQLLQKGYKNCKVYNPIRKNFMQAPEYPYKAFKALVGDKSDNIKGIISEQEAKKLLLSPNKFEEWLSDEENSSYFNLNFKLIEFFMVPEEEIIIENGNSNFSLLKDEFEKMKFNSLLKEKTWNKFCNTFSSIKY